MTKDPVDQLNVELFKILRLRFAPRSHDKLGVCLQSETKIVLLLFGIRIRKTTGRPVAFFLDGGFFGESYQDTGTG